MSSRTARRVPLSIVVLLLIGGACEAAGPASVHKTSADVAALADRVTFVNRYVTFRRGYDTLDFDVMYQNNGGGLVPGPSDWDVRLVATVPAAELAAWVPAGKAASPPPQDLSWF